MSEWIDTTLGEVLTLPRGFDLPQRQSVYKVYLPDCINWPNWYIRAWFLVPGW